jgi:HK97 family phage portal protein
MFGNSTFMQRFSTGVQSTYKAMTRRASAVLGYGVPTWMEGQAPTYSSRKFASYVEEGYKKNELVYACLTANAETAAQVALKVYDRKSHEEIEDHPLRKLLEKPSPHFAEYDFWALVSIYEDLAGVAYFEKVRNKAGEVIELFPLRPDYMKVVASSDVFISAYLYCVPGMQEKPINPRDVMVFRRFDPLDMRKVISPTAVASRVGDVDNAITDFLKVLQEKGFQPPGVLKSKLVLRDQDIDRILHQLETRYGGVDNWNKPLVLDKDAEYQRTGMTMTEMDFTSLDERNEARICAIYQIPPIIVGARIGLRYGTYSNYQEARLSWWEDKLTPKYKHRSDVIDSQLAPEFDDSIETEFDFSKVPALQEKKMAIRQRAWDEFKVGLITRNMFYKEIGENQLPPETGDVFLQSNLLVEVPIAGRPEPAPEPPPAELSDPDRVDDPPAVPPKADGQAKEGKAAPVTVSKDCYVLLDLADDPTITAIQTSLKAKYPGIEWAAPDSFHITLVYAENVGNLQVVRDVLPREINTFSFTIGGIGTFDGQVKVPIYLTVTPPPELTALQSGLAASFKALGLTLSAYSIPEQWHPHITLGYMPAGLPLPQYDGAQATLTSKIIKCSVASGEDAFETIWLTKTLDPDPAVIARRIAPHTQDGILQALSDVLVKHEQAKSAPKPDDAPEEKATDLVDDITDEEIAAAKNALERIGIKFDA